MIRQIPNLMTSFNLITGCVGIYFTLSGHKIEALYFVLIAAFFDVLDGLLARSFNAKSEIGGQLDSLADLVSFGVLPAFYILDLLKEQTSFFWAGILIVLFSAYRLAKFNVDASQTGHFSGLPTPANAIMITSLFLLPLKLTVSFLLFITFLSCFLLVSPVRLLALKFKNYGWTGNESRWILMIGTIIFSLIFRWAFVPFIVPFYIIVSMASFFVFKITRVRLK
ncbi:MAG: CDP-diacylglycerol--serine O-phosphatidyltransferase [Ekhidna sp.]|nr:CDP-diacylglycerol--serine O-phosphatidyltransferase [Ekhidna sp.]